MSGPVRIRNWSRFQHFRDRKPPWIKVYRDLLDDIMWHELEPGPAKTLVMLWLIASENDGNLPPVHELAFRLRMKNQEVERHVNALSHWLIQDDITAISQDDITMISLARSRETETETEEETERETETEKSLAQGELERAFEDWWSVCWRKVGKKAAKREYTAVVRRGEANRAELLAGAQATIAHYDGEGTETQFMCHPVTWLKQGRWKDDLTVRRKATDAEQLQAWVNEDGDERDSGGNRTLDGECLEVPEREPEGHGGGVSSGAAGSGRRGDRKGGPVAIGELVEDIAAQAGGHQGSGGGGQSAADIGQALAAPGADARRDHGKDPAGHVPRSSDHGSPGGEPATRASPPLAAQGVESHQQAAGGSAAAAWPTPIDLTPPAWMDKRSRK